MTQGRTLTPEEIQAVAHTITPVERVKTEAFKKTVIWEERSAKLPRRRESMDKLR